MYEEENTVEYVSSVKVPAETQNVKNPVMFNLTGRELLFIALAAGSCLITWLIFCKLLNANATVTILLCFLFGAPFLAFGFIRPSDMNLEDWLTLWQSNNINSSPVRKLSTKNAYEAALIKYKRKDQKNKKSHMKKDKLSRGRDALSDLYGKGNSYITKTKFFCVNDRLFKVFKLSHFAMPVSENLIEMFSRYFEIQIVSIDDSSYLIAGRKWNSDSIFSLNSGIEFNEVSDFLFDEIEPVELEEWQRIMNRHKVYEIKAEKMQKKYSNLIPLSVSTSKSFKSSSKYIAFKDIFVRTVLITGFSNSKAESLIQDINNRYPNVSTSIHLTRIWPNECLDALKYSYDHTVKEEEKLSEAQKVLMESFLKTCEKRGDAIYNSSLYIAAEGSKEEIEKTIEGLSDICSIEGLTINGLDNQQLEGYTATLPLLKSYTHRNMPVTGSQLLYFMPVGRIFNGQEAPVGA